MNRKGFVVEGVVLIGVLCSIVTVLLWKPVTGMLGIGNQPQKQKSTVVRKAESTPVLVYTDEKGKEHIAMATKTFESTLDSSEDRQMSLWDKIKGLGVGFIILMIAFPATIGAFGIRTFFKAKDNIKQLVKGIEEAKSKMPKESVDILETNLSKKMDQTVKAQVKSIKAKLP